MGDAVDRLTTKLTRVVVPPYLREKKGRIEDVEGYTYNRQGGKVLPMPSKGLIGTHLIGQHGGKPAMKSNAAKSAEHTAAHIRGADHTHPGMITAPRAGAKALKVEKAPIPQQDLMAGTDWYVPIDNKDKALAAEMERLTKFLAPDAPRLGVPRAGAKAVTKKKGYLPGDKFLDALHEQFKDPQNVQSVQDMTDYNFSVHKATHRWPDEWDTRYWHELPIETHARLHELGKYGFANPENPDARHAHAPSTKPVRKGPRPGQPGGATVASPRSGAKAVTVGQPEPDAISMGTMTAEVDFADQRSGGPPLSINDAKLEAMMKAVGIHPVPGLKIKIRLRDQSEAGGDQGMTQRLNAAGTEYRVTVNVAKKDSFTPQHMYIINNSLLHELRHVTQEQDDPQMGQKYEQQNATIGYGNNHYEVEARKFGRLAQLTPEEYKAYAEMIQADDSLAPGQKASRLKKMNKESPFGAKLGRAIWALSSDNSSAALPDMPEPPGAPTTLPTYDVPPLEEGAAGDNLYPGGSAPKAPKAPKAAAPTIDTKAYPVLDRNLFPGDTEEWEAALVEAIGNITGAAAKGVPNSAKIRVQQMKGPEKKFVADHIIGIEAKDKPGAGSQKLMQPVLHYQSGSGQDWYVPLNQIVRFEPIILAQYAAQKSSGNASALGNLLKMLGG